MPIPLTRSQDQLKRYFTADAVAARPTSWQVSLHTANPVLGNEVTDGAYARQTVALAVTTVDLGGAELTAQAKNTALVSFPAATASYSIAFVAIRDAANGDLLAFGPVSPTIPVVSGTVVAFDIDDLLIQD